MKFCEVTNETIEQAFQESISFLFYIVSYERVNQKEIEKRMKQMQKR